MASRTLLALARTPLPKIGSFILDEKGYLKLENRPLTLQLHQLENEHIPVHISRSTTYTSVDSYIHDILSFHESRLCHQPNSVHHLEDGFYPNISIYGDAEYLALLLFPRFVARAIFFSLH